MCRQGYETKETCTQYYCDCEFVKSFRVIEVGYFPSKLDKADTFDPEIPRDRNFQICNLETILHMCAKRYVQGYSELIVLNQKKN